MTPTQLTILFLWSIGYIYSLSKLTDRNLKELSISLADECKKGGSKHTSFIIAMLCFIFVFWPISLLLLKAEEWHERNKKKD